MRTHGLDGVQIPGTETVSCCSPPGLRGHCDSLWLVEEEVDDVVAAFGVVEENEQRPVDEPGPLLERLQRGAH